MRRAGQSRHGGTRADRAWHRFAAPPATVAGLGLVTGITLAACSTATPAQPPGGISPADTRLVADYFARNNAAAAVSSTAEQDFLRQTQHPDFPDSACELDGMALTIEPTMSTVRLDPGWSPPGSTAHPRGQVYFVAVAVTARRDGATVGNQIGYQHIVTIGQRAYGFAPCANR